MPGTFNGYPFNEDLFSLYWEQLSDPKKDTILTSGIVVNDSKIAQLIAGGSSEYTLPYYNVLTKNEQNYDGKTDIVPTGATGTYMRGHVYGRMQSYIYDDFTVDYGNGIDPEYQIASQMAKKVSDSRQDLLIKILDAVTGVAALSSHVKNIAATTSTVTDDNKLGYEDLITLKAEAFGDKMHDNQLILVMHSMVAAQLEILNYARYVQQGGILDASTELRTPQGHRVIVNDNVPVVNNATSGKKEYTTYLVAPGAVGFAPVPVLHPAEKSREALKNGGQEILINRRRETFLPYGMTFTTPANTNSCTDAQLGDKANYALVDEGAFVKICKIVSNV